MYVAYVIVKKVHMDKYKENKNDRNCDYCMHVPLWFGTQKISGTMIFLGEECTDYFWVIRTTAGNARHWYDC
jgi:hypothetical protein